MTWKSIDDTETTERRSPNGAETDAAPARARSARLIVVLPHDSRDVIALDDEPLALGRARLADATVSRDHLEITWRDGRHWVADRGSKNGSWLQGAPLSSARALSDGAVVRAGGVVLVYEAGGGMAPASRRGDDPRLMKAVPGRSAVIRELREDIARAAPDPSPVLVLGETGVGKEWVARELHRLSGRTGPFVAVNVTELSERLVESQLFGHVKGAFTGAEHAQQGLFRAARKGTLLLDEIGELPLALQAKLLRVVQEREVRPLGSTRAEAIDVRVIGATHSDLPRAVEDGRFRRDLWARLCMWELRVPALVERRADVIEWLAILYERWASERGHRQRTLEVAPEAAESLLMRELPENLRTLERVVHRLDPDEPTLGLAVLERALGAHGPVAGRAPRATRATRRGAPPPATREELARALAEVGSVHGLARHYGKDRRQIYRWLDQFGLRGGRP